MRYLAGVSLDYSIYLCYNTLMGESLVPRETQVSRYNVSSLPDGEHYVASVVVGDKTYSVMAPAKLDAEAIMADKRRYSRAGDLERFLGTPLEQAALLNRTVLLVAFDAYDNGELPKEAWAAFRVGVTFLHDELSQQWHQIP